MQIKLIRNESAPEGVVKQILNNLDTSANALKNAAHIKAELQMAGE